MSTVILEAGGGLPKFDGDGRGELTPFVWMVDELAPDDNPLTQPGVLRRGDVVQRAGAVFTCDSCEAEHVNDSCARVTSRFSTDGRFVNLSRTPPPQESEDYRGFTMGYKKVPIRLPMFTLGKHQYADPDGNQVEVDWWLPSEDREPIQLEFSTLGTTVRLKDLTNAEMLDVILQVKRQVGCLHQIRATLESWWVMQPASIVNDRPGELQIGYSWESDPGNSAPNISQEKTVVPPYRPGFYSYVVRRAAVDGGRPTIEVTDNYPAEVQDHIEADGTVVYRPNPFYQPDGWINLPGRPL